MNYHIDTGLIKDKLKVDCECPLCEIKQVVEEQFIHEFLNDAVMEDNTRIKVGKHGFCSRHFDMLFSRQNKLSVALQICTRIDVMSPKLEQVSSLKSAQKQADFILENINDCAICDLVEDSMIKYYKTMAQMFMNERNFFKSLLATKGFCLEHYAMLLKYAKYAGPMAKEYVSLLSGLESRNLKRIRGDLQGFCDKHDYRNALQPLGESETALPRTRIKLYSKKYE